MSVREVVETNTSYQTMDKSRIVALFLKIAEICCLSVLIWALVFECKVDNTGGGKCF